MGNKFSRIKTYIILSNKRELISEKSLYSVILVLLYLNINFNNRPGVRDVGFKRRVRQIAGYITAGTSRLNDILINYTPAEVTAGLHYFLMHLPEPIIPPRIQALALDATSEVEPETVAADILGLIKQDVKGRRLVLIEVLLDFLHFMRKHSVSNELSGSSIPVSMMPIFFQMEAQHMVKWQLITGVFMEIINLTPENFPVHRVRLPRMAIDIEENNDAALTPIDEHQMEFLAAQQNGGRMIIRQVHYRNDNNGDAQTSEIIRVRQRVLPPFMLNHVFGFYSNRIR